MSFLDLSTEVRLITYNHLFRGIILRSIYNNSAGPVIRYGSSLNGHQSANRSVMYEGTFRRIGNDQEIRDNFMAIIGVNHVIRKEAVHTMYRHLRLIIPGHDALNHCLVTQDLLSNVRHVELAMRRSDKLSIDFTRLPNLKILVLGFRDQFRYQDAQFNLPLNTRRPGFRKGLRSAMPVRWRRHLRWMKEVSCIQDRKFRLLLCFDATKSGTTGTIFIEYHVDGSRRKYEFDEDPFLIT